MEPLTWLLILLTSWLAYKMVMGYLQFREARKVLSPLLEDVTKKVKPFFDHLDAKDIAAQQVLKRLDEFLTDERKKEL